MDLPKCRFGYELKLGGHLKSFSYFYIFFITALWESTELEDQGFKFPSNVECLFLEVSIGFTNLIHLQDTHAEMLDTCPSEDDC